MKIVRIDNTEKPLLLHRDTVREEWVDEYDHMNLSYYVLVCDQATYKFWELLNNNITLEARGGNEYAVVESHVNYLREVRLNDPLYVTTQLLAYDQKRFRIFHEMYQEKERYLAATNEIMALGFDLQARSISKFVSIVQGNLKKNFECHRHLTRPKWAGRAINFETT